MAVPWSPRGLTDQELLLLIDHLQRVLYNRTSDAGATAAIHGTSHLAPATAQDRTRAPRRRKGWQEARCKKALLAATRSSDLPPSVINASRSKHVATSVAGSDHGCRHLRSARLPDVVPRNVNGMAVRLAVPDLWPPAAPATVVERPSSDGKGSHKRAETTGGDGKKFRLSVFPAVSVSEPEKPWPSVSTPTTDFENIGRLLRACARSLEEDDILRSKRLRSPPIHATTATGLALLQAAHSRWGLLGAAACLLWWALTTKDD